MVRDTINIISHKNFQDFFFFFCQKYIIIFKFDYHYFTKHIQGPKFFLKLLFLSRFNISLKGKVSLL